MLHAPASNFLPSGVKVRGPGYLTRYSDPQRAGRSGDEIPLGGENFRNCPTDLGAHPTSCTTGTGTFLWVKWPSCGANHPLHLAPGLKKE
jgi:hypothetical protein